MFSKFSLSLKKGEDRFNINAQPHIYFTKPNDNYAQELTRYITSSTHPKMIYLLNPSNKFNVFKYMERQFTITTSKGSYLFNIDFLKDTSSTIRESIQENPQHFQYHLNIKDEDNIMQKVEQLYLGEKVIFSDDELYLLKLIFKELNISGSLKSSVFGNGIICNNFQINLSHFYSYLKETFPRTFTIITKNKEYQCNAIGIRSSKIIDELLSKDPTINRFNYDFDDEFGEFQNICDLFNFKFVQINTDNMNNMKMIAEDLQIEIVLNDIDNFIEDYEKRVQTIDDQQSIIDSIDELFETLFNIQKITAESAKRRIIESNWISTEENIQELAAFILQAIQTDFILHPYLADLIQLLDKESNEFEQLKILVPFLVKKLMLLFGQDKLTCSFIFLLSKRGIITKDEIMNTLIKLEPRISKEKQSYSNPPPQAKTFSFGGKSETKEENKNYKEMLSGFAKISNQSSSSNNQRSIYCEPFLIFLPELFEINNFKLDAIKRLFGYKYYAFIESYFPNKIEDFKKMRESGEPDDPITKALLNDDVDTLQSIISKNQVDLTKTYVPFNIFDEFVLNDQTTYIDYSAAYGSLRCFKYLLLNHAKVTKKSFDLAVFGGNTEIIKIIDQKLAEAEANDDSLKKRKPTLSFGKPSNVSKNKSPIDKIISTIKKHQNNLFDWIFEQKFKNAIQDNNLIKSIIFVASLNGDSHSIASIVDKGFDFCNFDKNFCIDIIQNAASNGFYKFLKFLSMVMSKALDKYDNQINEIFNSNTSVFFGNISIFKFYFEKSNSLDLNKAISNSIKQENIEIIKYIFDNYLNYLIKNNRISFNDFLSSSIKLNTDDIFDYLFKQIKKIKSNSNTIVSFNIIDLLTEACKYKKVEISKKITEYILEKNQSNKNEFKIDFSLPFYSAALSGSIELCQYFVDKNLFINFELISLQYKSLCYVNKEILDIITKLMPPESNEIFKTFYLTEAISTQNKSLIEYILNQNAICSDDVLFDAVKTSNIDIVDMILNKNSEPSFINQISNSGTALNLAVSLNNKEIVKRLLSVPGIDPSLYEENNKTPLITSITNLNIEMMNLILDFYGPNLKSQAWQLDEAVKQFLNILSSKKAEKQKNKSEFLAVLNRLLEIDIIDLNCHADKYSFLSYACEANEIDIVKMMIKNDKVDVNSYSQKNGNTPLLIAIYNKNVEIAKLLIECERTNINLPNYIKETALLIAVENNLNEIVDIIINHPKFDPIESRLNYAFSISNNEISKQLATLKVLDVNYKTKYKYGGARSARSSNISEIDFIYYSKLDLFTTPLISAANKKLFDKVELILNHPSFDPNQSLVKDAIFIACQKNDYQIFNLLIKIINNDVNITNKSNQSLLQIAVINGCKHIISDIINNDKFDYDKSHFLDAFVYNFTCKRSSFYIMKEMYDYDQEHKKLFNFKDKNSELSSCLTLLDLRNDEISKYVEFLLELGVDPNKPDNSGVYPLEYAIKSKSIKMITALIDSDKIDFSMKINKKVLTNKPKFSFSSSKSSNPKVSLEKALYNCSYLHQAVKNDQILSIFLDKKLIDVNVTDSNGETPLMIACRDRNNESINLLFTVDELDYKHRNNEGKDAIEICMELFNKKCNDPHETKEQYRECLLQLLKKKSFSFHLGIRKNSDDSHDNDAAKNESVKNTPDIKANPSMNSENESQKEKGDSKFAFSFNKPVKDASNKSEQQTDEKPSLVSQKFGQSSNEKPSLTTSNFEQSTDKKFSFSSRKSDQPKDEKPSLTTSNFGQSTDKKFSFSFRKSDQPNDEKPSLATSNFGQSTDKKFSFSSRKSDQSSDEKPSLATSKFGQSSNEKPSLTTSNFDQSTDKKFSFSFRKSDQSNGEKPSLATSKFGQSGENAPKFGVCKPDQPGDDNPSFSSHDPAESDTSITSHSRSIFMRTEDPDGRETQVDDEIVAAICDTLNLDNLTHDQAVQITSRLTTISEKRCKENSVTFLSGKESAHKSNEESKERETTQQTREEIRGGSFEERTIRSPSNFLKEKRRHKFDLDDGFTDEILYNDRIGNNFYEPSPYQDQMMRQQWNQVMQIGNMRNIQFNMIMQQQEQMMMDLTGRKNKNSSAKHKSMKRKNRK